MSLDVPSTAIPYGGNQSLEDLFLLERLDVGDLCNEQVDCASVMCEHV